MCRLPVSVLEHNIVAEFEMLLSRNTRDLESPVRDGLLDPEIDLVLDKIPPKGPHANLATRKITLYESHLAFIWSYIYRLYKARQTGMKREVLGYVAGGYAPVLARFREHLRSLGVVIETGAFAEEVRDHGSSVTVRLRGGETHELDSAVMTIASSFIPGTCPQFSQEECDRLSGVVYQGVVCASVLLKKPPVPPGT